MNRLVFIVLCSSIAISSRAAESSKPIFIKATCDGKTASSALLALKKEIDSSSKYRLVHNLTDDGQMDLVLTINMDCREQNNIAGIATAYGQAKCFGEKNCHLSIDGSSLRSDLCESSAAAECGQALYKAFDSYASDPLAPRRLKLN